MNSLISYLGCGNIKHDEKYSWLQLIVTKFSDIDEKIIPIFREYKILGDKFKDFKDWCKVGELMKNKAHLTKEGLEDIRKLKGGMNTGRSLLLQPDSERDLDVSNKPGELAPALNKAKLPKGIHYYSTGAQSWPGNGNVFLEAHFLDEKYAGCIIMSYHGDEFWNYLEECVRGTIFYFPRITGSFELSFLFSTKDDSGEFKGGFLAYKTDFKPISVSSPTQYINSLRSILDNKHIEYSSKFLLTGRGSLFVASM